MYRVEGRALISHGQFTETILPTKMPCLRCIKSEFKIDENWTGTDVVPDSHDPQFRAFSDDFFPIKRYDAELLETLLGPVREFQYLTGRQEPDRVSWEIGEH